MQALTACPAGGDGNRRRRDHHTGSGRLRRHPRVLEAILVRLNEAPGAGNPEG